MSTVRTVDNPDSSQAEKTLKRRKMLDAIVNTAFFLQILPGPYSHHNRRVGGAASARAKALESQGAAARLYRVSRKY